MSLLPPDAERRMLQRCQPIIVFIRHADARLCRRRRAAPQDAMPPAGCRRRDSYTI